MTSDHGKKHRAGHVAKTVLAIIGGIVVVLALLAVALVYELDYAVRTVDTSTSPDGRYTLELQSVGEPMFFSPASARLVLKFDRYEVSRMDTQISDDGGQVRPTSWQVSWEDSGAEVRLRGSEQADELVTMGFDGSVSTDRATADDAALKSQGYGYQVTYNAKGDEQVILSQDSEKVVILVYDRESANGACALFALESCPVEDYGSWSIEEATLLDEYAYAYETGEVIASGKTSWSDAGTQEFRDATGE